MDRFVIGQRMQKLRDETGLTQTRLGVLCGGWTKSRIGNYEKGKRSPKVEDLIIIIEAFKSVMGSMGDDAYFYLFTGKRIPEFMNSSGYSFVCEDFAPMHAVKIMEDVVDVAEEVGIINFENKHKSSEFIALFSKKCYEIIGSLSSRKSL